jgi:hypothetical protein
MQVRCVRARAGVDVGDVADVPDGAEVSSLYWEVVAEASPPPAPGTTPGPDSAPPASSPASSAPDEESTP